MYQQSVCPACGAPVVFAPERGQVACAYCRSVLSPIQRGNTIGLELAEHVAKAVEASGQATRQAVEATGRATQAELQRIQWMQELASLEMQLTQIQGEMRAVQRDRRGKHNSRQLAALGKQETALLRRIRDLRQKLDPTAITKPQPVAKQRGCLFQFMRLVLAGVVWAIVVGIVCTIVAGAGGGNECASGLGLLVGTMAAAYLFVNIK